MMVERHYDDEALIAIMEAGRVFSDAHLPSCTVCNQKLDSFRTISGVLHEGDVWDTRELSAQPVARTIANLRSFANRMAAEDGAASKFLPLLLAGGRDEWMRRLEQHPQWWTAGMVRALVAATTNVVMTMPPDALAMTNLSTAIAERLDETVCDAQTIARLRGQAWRDRAYALYYVGRFAETLTACDVADAHFEQCLVDEYDRARVGVVRALALRAMEDVAPAMLAAQNSALTFERFEDRTRVASARLAEVHLLFTLRDFERAAPLLEKLESEIRATADANTHARVLGNLGYCYWQLGRIDAAMRHYELAAVLLDELGVVTESVRVRWNVAAVLASAGRTDEAMRRYRDIQKAFEDLGMTSEVAVSGLEMAELLLERKEFAAVEEICRMAIGSFERAGTLDTTRPLTALAYIQEAARQRTATPNTAKHVRDYIRRLPQERELLFAPPPPDMPS
jgi:tetratricopeptide (TPR) repeat protein